MQYFRFTMLYLLFFSAHIFSHAPLFEELDSLYTDYGNDRYMICEEVTQRTHVLQAAFIAQLAGAPEDVIIALLIHDIGQIAFKEHVGNVEFLHAKHDELGASWIEQRGMSGFVADFIRYHTIAKVVLCMEEVPYFAALSVASKDSYYIQRDKFLNEKEQLTLQEFYLHPRSQDLRRARKCDDMAKVVGLYEKTESGTSSLPSFNSYAKLFTRVYQGRGKTGNEGWGEKIDQYHRFMIEDRSSFEAMIKELAKNTKQ